ncbi:MAG TPA: rhomboid family intramembrane serine protease [Dinghuibacter sp.]|jgi:membrane associated rhomboid family serine protease|uniref:rhomboid family intramembrane serine protease n=1 Tax=Dinghuibacter sp. TaxID=2024697 RepID=UPI002CFBD6F4|nr:rhomboid family intramembrane serine protease [Dinghuibacter sp.]HTJ11495.1 rhomboid family intramembrane serine protease [Dinghuibacter sp.]
MSITLGIIIITVIISLSSFNRPKAFDDLSMWPHMIDTKKQYYRFITSGFIHGDFLHLFFNMITLYFFGRMIEANLTPMMYILFYVSALIISDIPTYFRHRRNFSYRSIGASGAISALLFASILFDPWQNIYLYFSIPCPAILYTVLYMAYCVYASKRQLGNINHDAHLWGGLYGWVFMIAWQPAIVPFFIDQLMHPHFGR